MTTTHSLYYINNRDIGIGKFLYIFYFIAKKKKKQIFINAIRIFVGYKIILYYVDGTKMFLDIISRKGDLHNMKERGYY